MITIVPTKELPEKPDPKCIYVPNIEDDSMCKKLNRGIETFLKEFPDEEIVCIRHDDATVRTKADVVEWQIKEMTKTHEVGVVGVIGCACLYPSCTWWDPNRKINGLGAIKQGGRRPKQVNGLTYVDKDGKPIMEDFEYAMIEHLGVIDYAATVDGCCMFFPRWIFEEGLRYDEWLPDFHFYDADICCEVLSRGYKVGINTNIEVFHKSSGEMPPQFNKLRENFYNKWNNRIDQWPISRLTKFKRIENGRII